ncbi:MAG: diacylglycerol kinase family lipid kinase [Eubacteriales bacterium]|nr:diacylglycerol kinase family lipid kinase [Eubacteriales bacterium]
MLSFIVNPRSSSGRGMKIWNQVAAQLQVEHIDYNVYFTEFPGHATRLAAELSAVANADMLCTIVAVGGDGTANEVIHGLHNFSYIRFAYIPSGSGNDLARGLQLPTKPLTALHSILHPEHIVPVNVGQMVSGKVTRRFIVSTGIGFDAAVCHEAEHSPIKRILNRLKLGKLTYLGIALKNILFLKTGSVVLVTDDEHRFQFDGILFAAAMNLRYEGGGFMFCPNADAGDDYLDICLVESMPTLRILRLLPTAFSGKHVKYTDVVHIFRCKKAAIHAAIPLAIHTDGEPVAISSDWTVTLLKEKLPVIYRNSSSVP